MNLRQVDLNLLVALDVMLKERNVIHAGATFWHHSVQKDDILIRMLPGKR